MVLIAGLVEGDDLAAHIVAEALRRQRDDLLLRHAVGGHLFQDRQLRGDAVLVRERSGRGSRVYNAAAVLGAEAEDAAVLEHDHVAGVVDVHVAVDPVQDLLRLDGLRFVLSGGFRALRALAVLPALQLEAEEVAAVGIVEVVVAGALDQAVGRGRGPDLIAEAARLGVEDLQVPSGPGGHHDGRPSVGKRADPVHPAVAVQTCGALQAAVGVQEIDRLVARHVDLAVGGDLEAVDVEIILAVLLQGVQVDGIRDGTVSGEDLDRVSVLVVIVFLVEILVRLPGHALRRVAPAHVAVHHEIQRAVRPRRDGLYVAAGVKVADVVPFRLLGLLEREVHLLAGAVDADLVNHGVVLPALVVAFGDPVLAAVLRLRRGFVRLLFHSVVHAENADPAAVAEIHVLRDGQKHPLLLVAGHVIIAAGEAGVIERLTEAPLYGDIFRHVDELVLLLRVIVVVFRFVLLAAARRRTGAQRQGQRGAQASFPVLHFASPKGNICYFL